MTNPSPELQKILKDFFVSFFPHPSQFELPPTRRNPTLYYDEYMEKYSPQISTIRKVYHFMGNLRDRVLNGLSYGYNTLWRGFVRDLYELTEGQTQPQSALDIWARGSHRPRDSHASPNVQASAHGLRVYLPYWVLVCSVVGVACLRCLRGQLRRGVGQAGDLANGSQTRPRADTDIESRQLMGGALGRSASLEVERKRYYGEAVSEGGNGGKSSASEDLLNTLWRTVGSATSAGKCAWVGISQVIVLDTSPGGMCNIDCCDEIVH